MNRYVPNRVCPCPRCRARGLMGAVILITLGVLFLLSELYIIRFEETFPALLIVIGLMMYLGRSASTEGHISGYPDMVPPPPPAVAGNQHDSEVNQ